METHEKDLPIRLLVNIARQLVLGDIARPILGSYLYPIEQKFTLWDILQRLARREYQEGYRKKQKL